MRLSTFAIAAALVGLALPAASADLAVRAPAYKAPAAMAAPFSWSGLYAGGHVGYLWGRTKVEENGVVTESSVPTNSVVGGVLVGANWQSGNLVLGAEGDFGWAHAHAKGLTLAPTVTELPNDYLINWTAHARGRLGYAADHWLLFVAGGLALADFTFTPGGEIISASIFGGKFTGFSIGGGVEYAFNNWLSGRVEYLYDDYGSKTYNLIGDTYKVSLTGQTVRGALVFRFNPN
jgi:outer membrane immunogenic protein